MNGRKHVARVTIMGEEYTIRSDAPPAHTQAVAEHVDRAIRRIMESGTVVETHKVAILAALQITDELFRMRADSEALAAEIHRLGAEVRHWLPPTKRGPTPTGSGAIADPRTAPPGPDPRAGGGAGGV